MSDHEEKIFASDTQQAIFDFTIVLAQQYTSPTIPFSEGLERACLWIESMTNDLRSKMKDLAAQTAADHQKLFTQK